MLTAALATSLLAAGFQMAIPVLVGVVIDGVVAGDPPRVRAAGSAAGVAALGTVVAGLAARRLVARAGESFLATMRMTTSERLLARPMAFFDRHPTGELVARATTDVAALSSFVRDWIPMLVHAVLLLVVTMVVLFASAWQLALVALVYLPGLAVVAVRFRRVAGPANASFAHARATTASLVHETLAARSWLQGIGATDARMRQLLGADHALLGANAAALRADNRTSTLQLLQAIVLAFVLLAGGLMTDGGIVTAGTVATFVLALRQLYQPLDTLGIAYGAIEGARADLARIIEVIEGPRLPSSDPTAEVQPDQAALAIELEGVTYSYDGETRAIDGVDLRIEAGEHVALVGATGSGKSTLAKLLAGLYAPDRGSVRIGGREAQSWSHDALRRAVVLLPQEVHLVAGTLADNLRLVPGDHDDAELAAAVERAGLGAWLSTLPDGLAADVGDRGANLSAGERQLVAFARATLAEPSILILDEATADIDAETERLLDAALERSARARTTIVVAHRPATAARADRRIVVDAGRVSGEERR